MSVLPQGPCGHDRPTAATRCAKVRPPCDRPCHSKVAGQDTACRVVERASPTLRRPKTQDKCQSLRDRGSLRSVRDFARKEWPLRGSTTSRSAIADRRHLSGGTSAGGHALWSQTGRGSATATVLIRSPYSCWLQRREWHPIVRRGPGICARYRHLRQSASAGARPSPLRQSFVDRRRPSSYVPSGTSPGRNGPFGAVRLTVSDESDTFSAWLMTSRRGMQSC